MRNLSPFSLALSERSEGKAHGEHGALRLLTILVLVAGMVSSQAALVLRYTFDDGSGNLPAADAGVGPAADGTLMGEATRSDNTPGDFGNSLDLTASGANYVTAGNPAKLNNLTNITITCWFNLLGNPAVNDRLIDKFALPSQGFGLRFAETDATRPALSFNVNGEWSARPRVTAAGGDLVYAPSALNQWMFVAVTFRSGTGGKNVGFFTGAPDAAVSQLGALRDYNTRPFITNSAADFRIGGAYATSDDRTPPMLVDDVRLYDAVLTQDELEQIRLENLVPPTTPVVTRHPAPAFAYEKSSVVFNAFAIGPDLSYQWYFNDTTPTAGATSPTLVLTDVTPADQGIYTVEISNSYGVVRSSAPLTVKPFLFNTEQMTNIWDLLPGDRPYLGSDSSTERSIAYNPVTGNLLLASRAQGQVSVVVLDSATGAEIGFLDTTGLASGSLPINCIGVAEDGVVYAANLCDPARVYQNDLFIWRWPDDAGGYYPDYVFMGNPSEGVETNRFGDVMAVRGAGADTQILLAPGSGTNVVLLRTMSTYNFQTEIPPAVIAVIGVPSGFARGGLAFGHGNTFWAKGLNSTLYLVEFDPDAGTGSVVLSYSGVSPLRGISVDSSRKWLAGAFSDSLGHKVGLYDIANADSDPVLLDQELFATRNPNELAGGPACTVFGGEHLFALVPNNGIKAFRLNSDFTYVATPSIKPLLLNPGSTPCSWLDATNSPAHALGALTGPGTWNDIVGDTPILAYSDGTLAEGVSVRVGRGTSPGTVDFNNTGFALVGSVLNSGIYKDTSPVKDGISGGGTTIDNHPVGLRIDGLAPGEYTIYFTGRDTSRTEAAPVQFFGALGPVSDTFSFSTETTSWANVSNPVATNDAAFARGENYNFLTATIQAGESLYLVAAGASSDDLRGFINSVEIIPGPPIVIHNPARILSHPPAEAAAYEGFPMTTIAATYAGDEPLHVQWYFNETIAIEGATNASLVLTNPTVDMTGYYTMVVSNEWGWEASSSCHLQVTRAPASERLISFWTSAPGSAPYLKTSGDTERSIAFNPVSKNLLLATRYATPKPNIAVLNYLTGELKHFMNMGGVPNDVPGAMFGVHQVGVADDGAVYGAGLAVNSASRPLLVWRWDNDTAEAVPTKLFEGDPGAGTSDSGLRWGDSFAVGGSGATTKLLLGAGSRSIVALFQTANGTDFTPTLINVNVVGSGFARFGVAFGPTPDTFWAKSVDQSLYLVQYDAVAGTGVVLKSFGSSQVNIGLRSIGVDPEHKWLAGITPYSSYSAQIYDLSDLNAGPVLADTKVLPTQNSLGISAGSVAFGEGFLYVLNCNNGITAYWLNANSAMPLEPFRITNVSVHSGGATITWESVAGHTYRVWATESLASPSWENISGSITAAGDTTSFTDAATNGTLRFYQVTAE